MKKKIIILLLILVISDSYAGRYVGEVLTIKYNNNLVYGVTYTDAVSDTYGYRVYDETSYPYLGQINLDKHELFDTNGNYLGDCIFDTNNECILDNSRTFIDPYATPQIFSYGNIGLLAEFVERFYQKILNRVSDSKGLRYWVTLLRTKEKTGSDIAEGFIFSDEFIDSNSSDIKYLEVLYASFFNRPPDNSGLSFWISKLEEGNTRKSILNGFLHSKEFKALADSYQIEPFNRIRSTDNTLSDIQKFVTRFYEKVLNRSPELEGLSYWTKELENKTQTASDIAKGFIFSNEFIKRELTNYEFINILYSAFFNRSTGNGESLYWQRALLNGDKTKEEVVDGFLGSQEFLNLANSYNITPF